MNRPNLFALLCVLMLAWLPVSALEFRNPVMPGYHPAPSVCRAGDKWVHLQNPIPDNYLCNDTMAVEKKYLMRLYPHGSLTENQQPLQVVYRKAPASPWKQRLLPREMWRRDSRFIVSATGISTFSYPRSRWLCAAS